MLGRVLTPTFRTRKRVLQRNYSRIRWVLLSFHNSSTQNAPRLFTWQYQTRPFGTIAYYQRRPIETTRGGAIATVIGEEAHTHW